jgi:hypothetical protein
MLRQMFSREEHLHLLRKRQPHAMTRGRRNHEGQRSRTGFCLGLRRRRDTTQASRPTLMKQASPDSPLHADKTIDASRIGGATGALHAAAFDHKLWHHYLWHRTLAWHSDPPCSWPCARSATRPSNTGDKLRSGARVLPRRRGHSAAPSAERRLRREGWCRRKLRQLHPLVRRPPHVVAVAQLGVRTTTTSCCSTEVHPHDGVVP